MKRILSTATFLLIALVLQAAEIGFSKNENRGNAVARAEMRVVKVKQNADLSKIMGEIVINTHYIFKHTHDLSRYGNRLTIGDNCILEFKKGGLANGRIKCKNVEIKGKKPKFQDVYIEISGANHVDIKNVNATYTFAVDDFIKITNSKNIEAENVNVTFDKDNRRLPNGEWIFTEGFDLTDCQNISFKKCTIHNAKSRNVDSQHGSLACKNCSDISVDGCSSSGGYNEVFFFTYSNNVTIKNTVINGGNGSGITLVGGENFVIDKCKSIDVGASGFSLNAKKIRVTNSIIKNWHSYGGITLGHSPEYARMADVEVANCTIENDSGKDHPDPIWAFGGVSEGVIKIHDCKMKTPRICTFDFIYKDGPVKLDLKNNYINVIKAEGPATTMECFRASGNYDLVIENNTFVGGAGITGYVRPTDKQPASNWVIKGNTFKNLGQMPIITPGTKDNISSGTFEFSNNKIEKLESIEKLINTPHYGKVVIEGKKN